ncbi:hypothetical protein BDU57DRAFT_502319 [Ampelomyces quisqualis]|uniref:Uncharacterized protein n=1 Tax=Ampelomyces quisqualis TaxID=50730 RepID=A0A6A5QDF5_AMPQU|nr:hypothetical protein BDU57DRAFT_502319 [Ampelomyces quisqualis]
MSTTISIPGLGLYLFELQGSLKCTLTRNGRPTKVYEFDESDLDDESHSTSDSEIPRDQLKAGIDASGVGVQLRLFKNDGVLRIEFEGKTGSTAVWTFEGLELPNGGSLVAAATTQTKFDPKECVICGATKTKILEMKHEETQTAAPSVKSTDKQTTMEITSTSTGVETNCSLMKRKGSVTTSPGLKRKTSSPPEASPLLHKRAKSKHDSPPWPRHLYTTCFRSYPIFRGDVGTLHIDVQEATVWFEGWFGKPHARIFERKQFDLRDPCSKFAFEQSLREDGIRIDNATHMLKISCLTAKLKHKRILIADLAAPGWKTWGSNEPDGAKIPFANPRVIIEALVYCVDVSSGRDAVHDPDALHELQKDVLWFDQMKAAGGLTNGDEVMWEFKIQELATRERKRMETMLCEFEDEEEKHNVEQQN